MTLPSYITITEASELAAALTTLAGMSDLLAQTDADLGSLLAAASMDLDAAMAYRGERYDTTGAQVLAFPRRAPGSGPYEPASLPNPPGALVWDWDAATQTAVVPDVIKVACLAQAAWLLQPSHAARLEAIRSGLTAQSVGSLSESYASLRDLPGGLSGLCDRAQRLMDRYRRRTAPLL